MFSRRDFLKRLGIGAGVLATVPLVEAAEPERQVDAELSSADNEDINTVHLIGDDGILGSFSWYVENPPTYFTRRQ